MDQGMKEVKGVGENVFDQSPESVKQRYEEYRHNERLLAMANFYRRVEESGISDEDLKLSGHLTMPEYGLPGYLNQNVFFSLVKDKGRIVRVIDDNPQVVFAVEELSEVPFEIKFMRLEDGRGGGGGGGGGVSMQRVVGEKNLDKAQKIKELLGLDEDVAYEQVVWIAQGITKLRGEMEPCIYDYFVLNEAVAMCKRLIPDLSDTLDEVLGKMVLLRSGRSYVMQHDVRTMNMTSQTVGGVVMLATHHERGLGVFDGTHGLRIADVTHELLHAVFSRQVGVGMLSSGFSRVDENKLTREERLYLERSVRLSRVLTEGLAIATEEEVTREMLNNSSDQEYLVELIRNEKDRLDEYKLGRRRRRNHREAWLADCYSEGMEIAVGLRRKGLGLKDVGRLMEYLTRLLNEDENWAVEVDFSPGSKYLELKEKVLAFE